MTTGRQPSLMRAAKKSRYGLPYKKRTNVKRNLIAAIAVATLSFSTAALADEGMWTFDNFPAASGESRNTASHIDQAWLDRCARRLGAPVLAAVRPRSSPSDGLVLTNHHCVRDCAQNLSTAKVDYVKDGFSAAKREDEKLCPGMQAEILSAISDVTARVTERGRRQDRPGFRQGARRRDRGGREGRLRRHAKTRLPLPGDHALSGRPVQALHLPQIFRCAAGLRAGTA